MTRMVSVVAAVITPQSLIATPEAPLGPSTTVLLAKRPEGKHLAGCWEFPGGQIEPNESHEEALQRELAEELGIAVKAAHPWTTITHHYPDKTVVLHIYRVTHWSGVAFGREGQAIEWVPWQEVSHRAMPAADRALIKAFGMAPFGLTLSLVDIDHNNTQRVQERLAWMAQSPWAHHPWWVHLDLGNDHALIQAKALSSMVALIQSHGHALMLNGSVETACLLQADGVYLSRQAGLALSERPSGFEWVAMACDDEKTLRHAGDVGFDYVTLSPLRRPHRSADEVGLGGDQFKQLLAHAGLPVLALGGLGLHDLAWVRSLGGFGIASATGFLFDGGVR